MVYGIAIPVSINIAVDIPAGGSRSAGATQRTSIYSDSRWDEGGMAWVLADAHTCARLPVWVCVLFPTQACYLNQSALETPDDHDDPAAFGFVPALMTIVLQSSALVSIIHASISSHKCARSPACTPICNNISNYYHKVRRDVRLPLLAVAIGSTLNFIGDWWLVLVRGGGVVGAAQATLLSQFVACGVLLRAEHRHNQGYKLQDGGRAHRSFSDRLLKIQLNPKYIVIIQLNHEYLKNKTSKMVFE